MSKRRLTDLYKVGREFTLDDGSGEPITVWLEKLNTVDHAEAARRADARRSRALASCRNKDSDEYQAILAMVYDVGDVDALIEYLVREHRAKISPQREAKIAAEDEWKEDNYLQGLQDDWAGTDDTPGLNVRYIEDPEDLEAKRVFLELKRFADQVKEDIEDECESVRYHCGQMSREELEAEIAESLIKLQGSTVWVDEFYRCQILFGVREAEDHKKRYFENRAEVDLLASETFFALRKALEDLSVGVIEGKVSPAVPDSSASSEPSSVEETSTSSGLVAVSG